MLKKISILRARITDWTVYPFCVPAIHDLSEITFKSRICFFAGENGSGKSTLIEAIAAHYGFGREGGTRNFRNDSTASNIHEIDYEQTQPLQIVRRFLNDRAQFLRELFKKAPLSFK